MSELTLDEFCSPENPSAICVELREMAARLWPENKVLRDKWLAAKAKAPDKPTVAISSAHNKLLRRTPRTMAEADGRHISL